MAISLYFGLPGCGKTTWLTKLALDAVRKGKYQFVYTNVHLNVPGVTIIDNECIGTYELENCLLLIDEATLFADSRDFKNFSKGRLEYFLEHRHRCADIILFTQQWDGVDRKIRVITDRVYYVYKGCFTGFCISKCWRVPYGILFPDPKKTGEKLGEIIQGYSKPPIYVRLFAKWIYRPKYYRYFDSWELEKLEPLPAEYEVIQADVYSTPVLGRWMHVSRSILKQTRKVRRNERRGKRKIFESLRIFCHDSLQGFRKAGKYCCKNRRIGEENCEDGSTSYGAAFALYGDAGKN